MLISINRQLETTLGRLTLQSITPDPVLLSQHNLKATDVVREIKDPASSFEGRYSTRQGQDMISERFGYTLAPEQKPEEEVPRDKVRQNRCASDFPIGMKLRMQVFKLLPILPDIFRICSFYYHYNLWHSDISK